MPVTDLIDNYIKINQLNVLSKIELSGDDFTKPYKEAAPGSFQGTEFGPSTPQMADTITFTTQLISKSEPAIEYNPLGPGFSVAGLGFINNNSREDKHKVIVTITTSEVDKIKVGSGGSRDIVINPPDLARRKDSEVAIKEKRVVDSQDAIIEISERLRNLSGF